MIKLLKNLWQNLKDPIVTKLKNSICAKLTQSNCDNSKNQIVMVIKMKVVTEVVLMTSFSKKKHLNTLTTDQLSEQLFATLAMFLWMVTQPFSSGQGLWSPRNSLTNTKTALLWPYNCVGLGFSSLLAWRKGKVKTSPSFILSSFSTHQCITTPHYFPHQNKAS